MRFNLTSRFITSAQADVLQGIASAQMGPYPNYDRHSNNCTQFCARNFRMAGFVSNPDTDYEALFFEQDMKNYNQFKDNK